MLFSVSCLLCFNIGIFSTSAFLCLDPRSFDHFNLINPFEGVSFHYKKSLVGLD